MDKIIKNIISPDTNIDITGNIFICDQLCNLTFKYKDNNKMKIKNNIKYLEIDYDNNSYINFNGGDNNNSKFRDYILKKIIIISPPKHFIKSSRNINDLEMMFIHESTENNKTLYQITSIILEPTINTEYAKNISYKLFEKFSGNIPTSAQKLYNVKDISDNNQWNAEDFLPDNRTFFTYNSPHDDTINYVVFQSKVYVPSNMGSNYNKYIISPLLTLDKEYINKIMTTKPPINPSNLYIFGRQVTKDIDVSKCKIKSEDKNEDKDGDKNGDKSEKKGEEKGGDMADKGTKKSDDGATEREEQEKSDKSARPGIEEEDGLADKKKHEEKSPTQKEEPKKGLSGWTITLIIIITIIFLIIISLALLYYFKYWNLGFVNFITSLPGDMINQFNKITDYFTTSNNNNIDSTEMPEISSDRTSNIVTPENSSEILPGISPVITKIKSNKNKAINNIKKALNANNINQKKLINIMKNKGISSKDLINRGINSKYLKQRDIDISKLNKNKKLLEGLRKYSVVSTSV